MLTSKDEGSEGLSKYKKRKFWRRLFTPRCFGDDEGILMKCCEYYLLKHELPCPLYQVCLKEGIKKQRYKDAQKRR